jgi:transcriptional regulator with XRE-family HTH domain
MDNLPTRLLVFRMSRGISQTEFAKIAGCSLSTYKNYEAGLRTAQPSVILNIATHFNVDPGGLMFGGKSALKKISREQATTIIKMMDEIAEHRPDIFEHLVGELNDTYSGLKLKEQKE